MKLETLLDEYFDARYKFLQYHHQNGHAERERQYNAIRARILSMDAEKDAEIDRWKGKYEKMISGWNEEPR